MTWLDAQPSRELVICSITVAEILFGIARMPDGKRKRGLVDLATDMFEKDFAGNILPFDADAAIHYAEIAAKSEARGKVADMADAQIAAIGRQRDAIVATRNVRHFDYLGVSVINPWAA